MSSLFVKPVSYSSTSYLPHLDGLRAVALLGVLLFHFEVGPFSGGFAGVDVFLSLSGYLITRNVLSHLADGSFSLRGFYTRRFFRLYPAAAVTILLSVAAAYLVFPDNLARETASSGLAAMLFSSNAFFHAKSGYFDVSATVKPLLHTWSLSLEEQYYFLWAPLLLFVWFLSSSSSSSSFLSFLTSSSNSSSPHAVVIAYRRLAVTLIALIVGSLAFGAYAAHKAPSWGFFELPARIYQFAAGALLHVVMKIMSPSHSAQSNESLPNDSHDKEHGLATLTSSPLASSTQYFASSSLPLLTLPNSAQELLSASALFALPILYIVTPREASSVQMAPVTLATIVLIALPETTVSSTILCNPFLRWMGSVSYSAYLVHWPLYVYSRFLSRALGQGNPHPVAMFVLSLALAQLLKSLVEDPVRSSRARVLARGSFFVAVVLTFTICAYGMATKGFAFRVQRASDTERLMAALDARGLPKHSQACCNQLDTIVTPPGSSRPSSMVCRVGSQAANATESRMVFFGNSFVGMWMPALHVIGGRRREWYRVYSAYSCAFRAKEEIESVRDVTSLKCRTVLDRMWAEIDRLPRGSTVVLALMWGFTSERVVRNRFRWITQEFRKRNLQLVVIGEPPGLHPQYESYFNCHDLLKLPIGSLLNSLVAQYRGRYTCGANPTLGFKPVPARQQQTQWCEKVLNKELANARYVNMFSAMCRPDRSAWRIGRNSKQQQQQQLCRVPVGEFVQADIIDPGYKRDLTHLSVYGSYNLVNVLEKLLFDNSKTR